MTVKGRLVGKLRSRFLLVKSGRNPFADVGSQGTQLNLLRKCGLFSDQIPAQILLLETLIVNFYSLVQHFKRKSIVFVFTYINAFL